MFDSRKDLMKTIVYGEDDKLHQREILKDYHFICSERGKYFTL